MARKPVKVYISFAEDEDKELLTRFIKHLSPLERRGAISCWHRDKIIAGSDSTAESYAQLQGSEIVLLLISPDFMANDYCYYVEMEQAIKQYETIGSQVIPILLRPVEIQGTPLTKFHVLPGINKALTTWRNMDEAFKSIIDEIVKTLDYLNSKPLVAQLSSYWYVPYARNPFFTGRKHLLESLHQNFRVRGADGFAKPQALSGLGGIGKTQIAVEYAYRYFDNYQAVLWIKADTYEAIVKGFSDVATILNSADEYSYGISIVTRGDSYSLQEASRSGSPRIQRYLPSKGSDFGDMSRSLAIVSQEDSWRSQHGSESSSNDNSSVNTVKRWLNSHTDWLLIFDNVNDLNMVKTFFPLTGKGNILLTTQSLIMAGIAERIEVKEMAPDEGVLFLLRRAGFNQIDTSLSRISSEQQRAAAEIMEAMGRIPLALDQAAAYVEETKCGFSVYIKRFKERRDRLLKRRGGNRYDHPESIAATILLCFERIEQANPVAAEMLRLYAFLDPDLIPDEIITIGTRDLHSALQSVATDGFKLDEAIHELIKFSLVNRNIEPTCSVTIHRLIQAVIEDEMNEDTKRQWLEYAIHAINQTLLHVKGEDWQIYLPHINICMKLIEKKHLVSPMAAQLLDQVGRYYKDQIQYEDAVPLLQQALTIRERVLGPEHPDNINSLDCLVEIFYKQGHFEKAVPLLQRVLTIRERVLGPEHPDNINSLDYLAEIFYKQGHFEKAVPLLQRVLTIRERVLGPEHPETAQSLSDLAELYYALGRYEMSKTNLQRALAIHEKALGPEHPATAQSLDSLAGLSFTLGEYTQAEEYLQRALAIREKALGSEHPATAQSLDSLAGLSFALDRYAAADKYLQRALTIREKVLGPEHPETAQSLENLAKLNQTLSKYTSAEEYLQRALTIREKVLGPEHPATAQSLNNLSGLYRKQSKYKQAEEHLQRALAIREKVLGPEHISTAQSLNELASLYRAQSEYTLAESFSRRALDIRERILGPEHPNTAQSLGTLAELYLIQGKYEQAEALLRRTYQIYYTALGPEHSNTAQSLESLARLYRIQGNYVEAESHFRRALSIREKVVGHNHPDTAQTLNNLAGLYREQHMLDQAEPFYQRSLAIYEKIFGPKHPYTVKVLENYAKLLFDMKKYKEADELETRVKTARNKQLS